MLAPYSNWSPILSFRRPSNALTSRAPTRTVQICTIHTCILLVLLLVSAALAAPTEATPPTETQTGTVPADFETALAGIRPHELARHLRFLASDELRGRDTGTPDARRAAEYLAGQIEAFGLKPCGDPEPQSSKRSYFAEFPLLKSNLDLDKSTLEIEIELGDVSRVIHLSGARDFLMSTRGLTSGAWESSVIYVGQGRPEDFEAHKLEGKFALVMEPRSEPRAESKGGRQRRGRFAGARALRRAAQKSNALGLLVVKSMPVVSADGENGDPKKNVPSEKTYRELMPWLGGRPQVSRLALANPDGPKSTLPMLYLESAARDFLNEAGRLAESTPPGPLPGVRVRLEVDGEDESIAGNNVIGILRGTDKTLAKEVIVCSAHYDHVGVRADGEIYNGADDNASGTSAILELAQAFMEGPRPRRTIVFLWVSGEEKGLLGSRWWVENPTLPDGMKIVANVNLDMVGRNESKEVSICPSPKHKSFSTLGAIAERSCREESFIPVYDADQYFERTDSYNFARRGIPIVFFHSGDHPDYHRVTDTIDKINFPKAAGIARMAYRLALEVANADQAPSIDSNPPERP